MEEVFEEAIMEGRNWRLGDDLGADDNLMDEITFAEIILQVHCNCRTIDRASVKKEVLALVALRLGDMSDLLERNLDAICTEAKKGRE